MNHVRNVPLKSNDRNLNKSMNWFIHTLTSTIGRKVLMALTGLFLILFLVIHLIGNLQLISGSSGKAFNLYAEFMGSNPLIQTVSIGNFFFILLHVFVSIMLTRKNKSARGTDYAKAGKSSTWSSRNMGILGTIILIFLVAHLKGFWFESKFGSIPEATYDGQTVGDLYTVVSAAFSEWWYAAFYVVCMGFLAFHLYHGFQSAFKTLGLNNKKYTPVIEFIGLVYSIAIPALYALIPIWMFLN